MSEQFKYDVFISYSSHDKPVARELAERLRRDGLRVWPGVFEDYEGESQPGEARRREIEAALEQARTLVLMLSRHASAAELVTFERHTVALHQIKVEDFQIARGKLSWQIQTMVQRKYAHSHSIFKHWNFIKVIAQLKLQAKIVLGARSSQNELPG